MNWRSLSGAIVLAGIVGAGVWALRDQGRQNFHVTFDDAAFEVASTAASKTLLTLSSARQKVTSVVMDPQTAFAGTGISAVVCTVGSATGGNEAIYLPGDSRDALSVMQVTAGQTAAGMLNGRDLVVPDTDLDVVLHCTATGASFGNGSATVLTQGAVEVTVFTVKLPDVGATGSGSGPDAGS